MSLLEKKLIEANKQGESVLIQDGNHTRSKLDYIEKALPGTIIAFRLNFESKRKVKLTKVISGMVESNDVDGQVMVVETKNHLRYAVPYSQVVWVKSGDRWARGVYEEMRLGAVPVDANDETFTIIGELPSKKESDIIEFSDEDLNQ